MQRFARIQTASGPRFALVGDVELELIDAAPWERVVKTGEKVALAQAKWLTPTAASKVVAIGQNYRKHAAEMGKGVPEEPLLFMKPPSALNPHEAPIVIPPASQDVQHEAELALVIGKTLSRATETQAVAGIFAVSCFNDVTARDIQKREVQHTRAKSYDTFACYGPWMVRGLPYGGLRVTCRVNGQVRQEGRASEMVHGPARLVSFISSIMTLLPGDVVITGTPSGVARLLPGDVVEVEIERVGVLRNPVTDQPPEA